MTCRSRGLWGYIRWISTVVEEARDRANWLTVIESMFKHFLRRNRTPSPSMIYAAGSYSRLEWLQTVVKEWAVSDTAQPETAPPLSPPWREQRRYAIRDGQIDTCSIAQ